VAATAYRESPPLRLIHVGADGALTLVSIRATASHSYSRCRSRCVAGTCPVEAKTKYEPSPPPRTPCSDEARVARARAPETNLLAGPRVELIAVSGDVLLAGLAEFPRETYAEWLAGAEQAA
jgi:hypothetical protein